MRAIVFIPTLSVLLASCGSLLPPPPETEITLKEALLDSTDSLVAMKNDLSAKGKHLNMYVDDMTVEFYVKGSRSATAGVSAEAGMPPSGFARTLVIKPSYSATGTGERQNKVTIKFKSISTLSKDAQQKAEECLKNPNCLNVFKNKPKADAK